MIVGRLEGEVQGALSAITGLPAIIWPNEYRDGFVGDLPWVEVSFQRVPPFVVAVNGRSQRRVGVQCVVVHQPGEGEGAALTDAKRIYEEFPVGLRVPPWYVRAPVHIGDGFTDGATWRLPVTIEFEAFA